MNDVSRPRGRPRKFDRDEALDGAVRAFWANGFDGASLDVLTKAMGVNRPSLYASFGNKHDLFMEAVDRYASSFAGGAVKALYAEADIRTAVAAFFVEIIRSVASDGEARGCLIANVSTELSGRDETVCAKISAMIARTDGAVAERLRSAQNAGQLSSQVNPQAMARMIVSITHGLATRARIGESRQKLSALASDFMAVLFPA